MVKGVSAVVRVLMCRRAAAMVEYALLAALIAVVATVALRSIGTSVSTKFAAVATSV